MALHAARSRRRSRLLVPLALLALVVALGAAWVRVGDELDQARASALDRLAAVQAAKRYALTLMALDYRTVDRDVARVMDVSTGQAREEFARQAQGLKDTTRRNKAVQTGVVRAAGLASMNEPGNTARVLIVADSVIRWDGTRTAPQERFYRWSVEVTKVGEGWSVSRLEQVA
ncbi:hypothetical protein Sme01_74640 [Sphaerisporangium melleum]|uniref:Mce-associated membrane protein n=1 Tax=Sphaerisporangium melleum TaxID=321316 RepID=A0A917RRI2_9ACTN|nr:hypothetical protein [Sphaerisporangium melleum]GGL21449.1 hypothetical protein GCM10007964_74210 [Sphaerisporangium melleum]GII74988.1 hypothetical protein Sme01_74640 [Sphaerisporangium melleum]